MSRVASRRLARGFAVLVSAALLGSGLLAGPAFADEPSSTPPAPAGSSANPKPDESSAAPAPAPAGKPDLRVTASLTDDRTYLAGEDAAVRVTVTNAGDAAATAVKGSSYSTPSGFSVNTFEWGDLDPTKAGGTIAPGETKVLNLKGSVSWAGGNPRVTVEVRTENEANFADNRTEFTVSVLPPTTKGRVSGIVFGDRNGNKNLDEGEELSGAKVLLYGRGTTAESRTGSDGRFTFTDVAAGVYSLSYQEVPGGWIIPHGPNVAVDGSDKTEGLRIRGVRPLSEILQAKIEFGKSTYQPGDVARVRITLSNKGTAALTGVVAGCNRSGEGPHLTWDARWGPFAPGASGVTIGAGETRSFDVSGTVPVKALDWGYVYVGCDFGNDETYLEGFPYASDNAKVPGRTGDTWLTIYQDRNANGRNDEDEGIADTKVGLVDPDTGKVVAKAVTNEAGRVDFADVPAGPYRVRVFGPWKLVNDDEAIVWVRSLGDGGWVFAVVPGPDQPDTDEVPPAPVTEGPSTPAPQASVVPAALASTGADVTGQVIVGVAMLFVGAGALLVIRRRRKA